MFADWPAMKLAVEHHYGEVKAAALLDEILRFAKHRWEVDAAGGLPSDRVEKLLDDGFSKAFPGELRDGSARQLSRFISRLFRECKQGNFTFANEVRGIRQKRALREKATRERLQQMSIASKERNAKAKRKESKQTSSKRANNNNGFDALMYSDDDSDSEESENSENEPK
eukprot:g3001.t1